MNSPFQFQTFANQVKNSGELAEHQGFVTFVSQPLQHLMEHLHFAAAVNYVLFMSRIRTILRRPNPLSFYIGVIAGHAQILS